MNRDCPKIDALFGATYGSLTVIDSLEALRAKKWTKPIRCRCSCGREVSAFAVNFVYRAAKVCGCRTREKNAEQMAATVARIEAAQGAKVERRLAANGAREAKQARAKPWTTVAAETGNLTQADLVYAQLGERTVLAVDLASELALSSKTVSAVLCALADRGRAQRVSLTHSSGVGHPSYLWRRA